MEVVDNFLEPYYFDQLYTVLMEEEIPWYYNDCKVRGDSTDGDGLYQFIHGFYHFKRGGVVSDGFDIFEHILYKLRIKELYRIKANLTPRTKSHDHSGWHVDFPSLPVGKTAIFYMNTNNGWTKFKKGGRVKSVANRMVIFDSDLEHAGVTCTDEKRRVVVNFNYVPAL